MVSSADLMANAKQIGLTALDVEIGNAFKAGKYCLILDKNGNVNVFFRYKRHQKELAPEILKSQIGSQTTADVIEVIRKSLVHCMRTGETLALNCDKISPDFIGTFNCKDNLPLEEINDFVKWRQEANFRQIVRKDEDHDIFKNDGFEKSDKFTLCYLQTYTSDEEAHNFISHIPLSSHMQILIVS